MSQLRAGFFAVLFLLIASNAMWATHLLSEPAPEAHKSYGCTESEQFSQLREQLIQPIAVAVNASVKSGADKQSILAAISGEQSSSEHLTCVIPSDTRLAPGLGLRFSGDRLVAISTLVCTPNS